MADQVLRVTTVEEVDRLFAGHRRRHPRASVKDFKDAATADGSPLDSAGRAAVMRWFSQRMRG